MNTLLDFTGALLYYAVSIILLPLFVLVDGFVLSVWLYKNARATQYLF